MNSTKISGPQTTLRPQLNVGDCESAEEDNTNCVHLPEMLIQEPGVGLRVYIFSTINLVLIQMVLQNVLCKNTALGINSYTASHSFIY